MASQSCSTCCQPLSRAEIADGRCRACIFAAALTTPQSSDHSFHAGPPPQFDLLPSPFQTGFADPFLRAMPYAIVAAIALTVLGLWLTSTRRVHVAPVRGQTVNHMKQIALACEVYHDIHKQWPAPTMVVLKDGKWQDGGLSWRVTILPMTDELYKPLFAEFDQTVNWDHDRNAVLQNQMPSQYQCPLRDSWQSKTTPFQYFTGPDTLFPDNAPRTKAEIKDGLANTFLFAEAAQPAIWTQPADMVVRPDQPLPLPADFFMGAMADASIHIFRRERISDAVLRLLISPADGSTDFRAEVAD